MGLGDLAEVEDAFGIKREAPVEKPTIEGMLSGILEASVLAADLAAGGSKSPERVCITIERNTRTGYVRVTEQVTGIESGEVRRLHAAVESLYQRLAAKAAGEERKAQEMLKRLGVKPEPDGPQG